MTKGETQQAETTAANPVIGIGFVIFSTVLLSIVPNAAKIAYQEGANPLAVITIRAIIGVIGLALYLTLRKQWPESGWKAFRLSSISGVSLLFTSIGFMGAVAYIDVSLAALIFYLHPFLVAIIGHFRGDIRLTLKLLLLIFLAITGLTLVLGVTLQTLNIIGIGLSLLGMAGAATLILMVAGQTREVGPIAANFYMSLWASIYLLLTVVVGPSTGLIGEWILPVTLKGWISILVAGVALTIGFVMFFIGARFIGTTRAVMLSLTEPLFAILLAILLVHEWLTLVQWVGVVFIIGSLYLFEITSNPST